MNSKKEKYMINTVWVVGIFVLWELIAFLLDGVLHDPMAEAKLPYPHMSLSKIAEKIALPYLVVSQMIPVLGLAPIIFTLAKDMNLSRIIISGYITFFPVSVNMLSGLNSVESEKKELLYSYAAKKPSIYCKLMIPYCLPYLFAGLKIAAPMSITASILVDMLGSSGGIGVKLLYSLYSGTKDIFWSSVLTSALMGILSYFIIVFLEKICMPWRKEAA